MNEIDVVHFSPSGTTKTVSTALAHSIRDKVASYDLLKHPQTEDLSFISSSPVIFAMPVFAGRIPQPCPKQLAHCKGNGTPAIAVVVYGNRAHEDALLELTNILNENGFVVIAAAAFVAQHSLFTGVAQGRPDDSDMDKIREFGSQCKPLIAGFTGNEQIEVSGKRPYKKISSIPISPKTSSKCNSCGTCARLCPVQAIDVHNPSKTIKSICIACTACISNCPQQARSFGGPLYATAAAAFTKSNSGRKEPEYFFAK